MNCLMEFLLIKELNYQENKFFLQLNICISDIENIGMELIKNTARKLYLPLVFSISTGELDK